MKVLLTAEVDDEKIGELFDCCDVTEAGWRTTLKKLPEEELTALLKDKDILITSYDTVSAKIMERCPRLKLIACTRSNPVNIDIAAAKEKDIAVIYTPGRNSDSTAEFAFALMLSISRKIPFAYNAIKEGAVVLQKFAPSKNPEDVTWGSVNGISPYTTYKGFQLKNKTLGIVGYGSIGRRVGEIAKGFGMEILIFDPYVSEVDVDRPGTKKVDFYTLLSKSDFITCHTKVTDSTKGMFDRDAFLRMKKTAYFINDSRGGIVIEADLIEALKNGDIAGAALDVFENEPLYKDHPFVNGELDNIIVTPHIAGATFDSITNHTMIAVGEVKRFIKGEPLLYRV